MRARGTTEQSRDARPARILTVDWSRCAGHGVCAAALGERIDLDRWGYPTGVSTRGVGIPADKVEAARLAVVSCPAAALRLHRPPAA